MIRVRYYGAIGRVAGRKTHRVDARTYREVLTYTQQFYDLKSHLATGAIDVRIGDVLADARYLNGDQVARWSIPSGATIHVVPNPQGNITGAILITALVSAAISIGVTLLSSLLFPPPSNKTDNRKSALYQNGLNTSQAGAPLPYLAGDTVFCGGNVIEGDYDYSNSGGANAYNSIGGLNGAFANHLDSGTINDAFGINQQLASNKGKSGGGKTISNTTYSNATIKFAMAVGSGEVGGIKGATDLEKSKNILVNQVPLIDHSTGQANYPGFTWEERLGIPGQEPLKLTPGVSSPFTDGTDLKRSAAAGGGQFYIPKQVQSAKVDLVKLDFRYPQLVQINKDNNQAPATVTVAADIKRLSSGDWTTAGAWTITEKSSAPFDRQFTIAAPPADDAHPNDPWQFRVYRVTPDSTDDKLQNATTFQGWVEVQKVDRTYDGSEVTGAVPTALFAAAMDGAQFDVQNKPEIALIMQGRKVRVPDNYDPVARTYSGIWGGGWSLAVTANPVWHWLEIATATDVGCGFPLAFFDKFDLLQTAKRCDEVVHGRHRYSVNKQFTDQTEGWQFLVDFAQTFRAVPHFNGSQVVLSQDRPGTPDHFINNSQVEDGKFRYAGTPGGEQFNECVVQYDDPENYYRVNQVTYQDTDAVARNRAQNISNNGIVTTTVYKIGCTDRQEAFDYARAIVFDAQNQNNTVTFNTSINACGYAPGQRIQIDDWNLSGKEFTGRIVAISDGQGITIDNAVTLRAGASYDALVVVDNRLSRRSIAPVSATTKGVTIAMETIGLEPDTPVSIVENDPGAAQPTEWRINDIQEQEPTKFTVTASLYVEGKHAFIDDGTPVTKPTCSQLNVITPVPTGLTFMPFSYVDDIQSTKHGIQVSWDRINTISDTGQGIALRGYELEVRRPNGSTWEQAYKGADTFTSVLNADPGEYEWSLRSISSLGRSSAADVAKWTFTYDQGDAVLPPIFLGFK